MACRKCASAPAARPLSLSTIPRRLCATASLPFVRSALVNDASASSSRPSENALLALAKARDLRSDAKINSPSECRYFVAHPTRPVAQAVDEWRRSVAITPTAHPWESVVPKRQGIGRPDDIDMGFRLEAKEHRPPDHRARLCAEKPLTRPPQAVQEVVRRSSGTGRAIPSAAIMHRRERV